jgi:hypothetical protein
VAAHGPAATNEGAAVTAENEEDVDQLRADITGDDDQVADEVDGDVSPRLGRTPMQSPEISRPTMTTATATTTALTQRLNA